ncbi:MAG: polyhydroxybutyrate depolymerase, partial [Pseudomonadota bacterium]
MRFILALLFVLPTFAAAQCGPEAACEIDGGSYHMIDGGAGTKGAPALVFFHGHNATGQMIFRGGIKSEFADAGYVVIAPNGTPIEGRESRRWAGRTGGARDDVAFVLDVVADARTRASIHPDKIYVAGFSA